MKKNCILTLEQRTALNETINPILQKAWNHFRKSMRDYASLHLRLLMAIRHRSIEETIFMAGRILMAFFYGILCLGIPTCFIAGFFKPHCFITLFFYIFIVALWRSTMEDFKNFWK